LRYIFAEDNFSRRFLPPIFPPNIILKEHAYALVFKVYPPFYPQKSNSRSDP